MKQKLILLVVICSLCSVYAQQEPQYTQYMYNMSVVNPAYMINEPSLMQVGALYRAQWVGIDGSPESGNVFANIPLNNKIELSANYLYDKIGNPNSVSRNLLNIDLAYKINLNKTLNLAFGVKLGLDNFSNKFSPELTSSDSSFQNISASAFNFGTGAFLFGDNYYVGLSSPNLLPNKFGSDKNIYFESKQHFYLIGGYVLEATDMIKLKPSVVVKQTLGAPMSFDVSANAMYNNKFEFGLAYRYQDSFSALAGFNITKALKLGYSYDYSLSSLNTFNTGSHEVVLMYTFDVLGLSKTYSSPRFY